MELLAVEPEGEAAFAVVLARIALGLPAAAVPEHDRAAAVLPLRDRALEAAVIERVVLDMDGKPLLAGDEARTLGDRPALEHAVELEAEIVMEAARGVLLDDEAVAGAGARRPRGSAVCRKSRLAL